ncbi:MAG: preprotein translocase subunit SecG [Planctomycetes bacterium]|nr:preprotein translocase subunit SecG [Planctomycetota bacterium]
MSLLITLLYFLFILASVVLIVVILLQEGKGGGFGQALGTSGQETFGAGARGINTFTAVCVGVFLVSAMLITVLNRMHGGASVLPEDAGSSLSESAPPGPVAPPAGTPSGN